MFLSSTDVYGETNNSIDIETNPSPDSYLFDMENMKPGDWIRRKLTIQNRGRQDFTYNTQVDFKGGSKKLYEEFLLKVSDSNGVLYDGKLKDFNGLASRSLKSMNEEDLLFVAEFPYELGNEFQGLGFDVEFRFIVEGHNPPPPGGGDPGDDPDKPENPDNPNNPTDPNNPEEPGNPDDPPIIPDNPEEPTNPSEPQDPDKINPQHPIDPENLKSPPVDGQILPSTATNIYNYVLGGFVLLSVGGILYILQRKRTIVLKK